MNILNRFDSCWFLCRLITSPQVTNNYPPFPIVIQWHSFSGTIIMLMMWKKDKTHRSNLSSIYLLLLFCSTLEQQPQQQQSMYAYAMDWYSGILMRYVNRHRTNRDTPKLIPSSVCLPGLGITGATQFPCSIDGIIGSALLNNIDLIIAH